ncbi:hypothetical protein Tco_0543133 [Tanacetum coccineum]
MVLRSGIHIHEGSWIDLDQPLLLHGTGVLGLTLFVIAMVAAVGCICYVAWLIIDELHLGPFNRARKDDIEWADSVSTAYLIYRIPYIPIGLRIPEEEWRGKDTSLAHLKVFGRDSFVKVKDVCGEAMNYSIYEARSATDSSSLTKPIQKSQVVLVDIPENLVENDSIATEHGLSSEITQSLGGSSDTSEGSENSGSFKDSGRSDEEYFEDGASSKEGGFETPQVRRSTREFRAPVRYSPSANYLQLTENGEPESFSEALSSKESLQWKKAIIEEMVSLEKIQTCSLEPSYVRALNDTSTQHKSKGFQLAGQEENLECRLKEILWQKLCSDIDSEVLYLMLKNLRTKPCRDVHQVGDEREVEVLRNFNQPPK